ncbi:polar amino acid transport system substrate-binding protein [Virgibacillus natechei]|uniref:Polar amino acid transport system substrate-binding protein n=1 Tax=Virgibacillus natechei TaxID=1216297 RepID=A0ABS4IC86_9BACI|nr:ectoine/hydroxyectoine ABC transporter substrate-binding protein EhuB [Virgibacillus natechei]MBP1968549.1 polar amino acid transport system substrate-binding protein [Virgibacillus natechei]UZD13663.1 ectoine/hydroxyectoine ABC transporter substrate-binding protein EhuB [Virgibacillus natechei]
MRKLLLTLVLLLAVVMLAACGGSDEETGGENGDNGNGGDNADTEESGESSDGEDRLAELQEAGTVTVGFANEEPYGYQGDDGELKGAAVDIAEAVFAELGVDEMDSQLQDFSQLIPGLNAGQYDLVTAGMAITPDRCENAIFAEPEMVYGEGVVVQAGNPLGIESYEDIANNPDIRVSVMSGATEIGYLETTGVSDDQVTNAPDIPATFSAVQADRADVTTATEMTLRLAMETSDESELEFVENFEQPDIEGVPSYGAPAFHPDNADLRDAYNEALEGLKEDGTVADLLEANGFDPESNFVAAGEVTAESVCSGENY